jgi:hypothetical protein
MPAAGSGTWRRECANVGRTPNVGKHVGRAASRPGQVKLARIVIKARADGQRIQGDVAWPPGVLGARKLQALQAAEISGRARHLGRASLHLRLLPRALPTQLDN